MDENMIPLGDLIRGYPTDDLFERADELYGPLSADDKTAIKETECRLRAVGKKTAFACVYFTTHVEIHYTRSTATPVLVVMPELGINGESFGFCRRTFPNLQTAAQIGVLIKPTTIKRDMAVHLIIALAATHPLAVKRYCDGIISDTAIDDFIIRHRIGNVEYNELLFQRQRRKVLA